MVKPIVTDLIFLKQRSEPAVKADRQVVTDLLDTLKANADHCVGLAANMIGERKTILAAHLGNSFIVMINPVITSRSAQTCEAEEGCLSLKGTRTTVRHTAIAVEYLDKSFKKKKGVFHDFDAQIIQHEMDHFNGIII